VPWLLDRLGFDKDSFWQEPDPVRYIDPRIAIETVACAHAAAVHPDREAAAGPAAEDAEPQSSFRQLVLL
jgi:hypothetical protein